MAAYKPGTELLPLALVLKIVYKPKSKDWSVSTDFIVYISKKQKKGVASGSIIH